MSHVEKISYKIVPPDSDLRCKLQKMNICSRVGYSTSTSDILRFLAFAYWYHIGHSDCEIYAEVGTFFFEALLLFFKLPFALLCYLRPQQAYSLLGYRWFYQCPPPPVISSLTVFHCTAKARKKARKKGRAPTSAVLQVEFRLIVFPLKLYIFFRLGNGTPNSWITEFSPEPSGSQNFPRWV